MRQLIAGLFLAVVIVVAAILLWPSGDSQGIVLYSALDYGQAVAKAFTAKTGIAVHVIRLPTGGLLARVTAEGHHPDWTVAWFDGATAAVLLDRAGLLGHRLTAPADLTATGKTMLSPDGAYVPTGFTLAGVFVSPRNAAFTVPTTWSQLTEPAYRGLFGMNNPSISGPTYPALAGMLASDGGWPAGKSFIEALKQNGLHVFPKNDATLAALRNGTIKLAIVQSSAALHVADEVDRRLRVTFPRPAYVLPNVIVMARGLSAAKRKLAERFIAYVNSPAAQAIRVKQGKGDGYYWPVTRTPAPRHALPALSTLAVAPLNAARWGAKQNTIVGWFTHAIVSPGT